MDRQIPTDLASVEPRFGNYYGDETAHEIPTDPASVESRFGNYRERSPTDSLPPSPRRLGGGMSEKAQTVWASALVAKPRFHRHGAGGEEKTVNVPSGP